MLKQDEYVRLAAQCLRISQESDESRIKAMTLMMAEAWVKLAEQVELFQPPADDQPNNSD